MSEWPVIVSLLILLVGMLFGAWLWSLWLRRQKVANKLPLSLQGLLPLRGRALVSSHEKEVWQSLRIIFHDHAVMVKIPILRFTQLVEPALSKTGNKAPTQGDGSLKSDQWLEMIDGLYTTFTICTLNGKVVGCVDVLGRHEGSKASRELKEALLLDCGIAYAATSAFNVSDGSMLRELFLGELPEVPVDNLPTRGGDSDFHADMAAFSTQQGKKFR